MVRSDQRKVKDLWVINSLSEPRPTLETYKYEMPGENEVPIDELLLFDLPAKTYTEIKTGKFKDQTISIWSQPTLVINRDDDYQPSKWLGTNKNFYFTRTSRDLKRVDQCVVDIASGAVKSLIEEELNTYVEVRRPGLINGGKELLEWSERDGWVIFIFMTAVEN